MEDKFRKAFLLMLIPAIINIAASVYCYFNFNPYQFAGYLTGTILGIVFSALWLWMIKRVTVSNPFKVFKVTTLLFPVKLLVFVIVAFGSSLLMNIDQIFFGIAFLIATILTLIVEVRFVLSINRIHAEKRKKI